MHAKQVFEKENKETAENNLVQKAFVLLNWLGFVIQVFSIKKDIHGVVIAAHQEKGFCFFN